MVFKKIIFQNSLMANETPSRPPPFMANAILNFHFDFLHPSLRYVGIELLRPLRLPQVFYNQGLSSLRRSVSYVRAEH